MIFCYSSPKRTKTASKQTRTLHYMHVSLPRSWGNCPGSRQPSWCWLAQHSTLAGKSTLPSRLARPPLRLACPCGTLLDAHLGQGQTGKERKYGHHTFPGKADTVNGGEFPGGTVVKNPSASAGDTKDMDSISQLGRCPGGGNGNPLQYSCLENPMDTGAWRTTVHGVIRSSNSTDPASTCDYSVTYLSTCLYQEIYAAV